MIYHGDAKKYIQETPKVLREIWRYREDIFRSSIKELDGNISGIYLTGAGSSFHLALPATGFKTAILQREM